MVNLKALAEVRRQKLLSQEELAQKAKVSRNTIHRLETGASMAQGRTVRKLAEALGVEPRELMEIAE